jgi:hypothetical protein
VVVIGAGAAGLVAAFRAAECGHKTLLLEKNKRPGIKILMSGGTRCNITQATDNRGIVKAFGPSGRFLHSSLAALGVDETIVLFEAEGVRTKVEETGKVFPVSNRAADVLRALLARLSRSGAELSLSEPVDGMRRVEGGFELATPSRTLHTSRVILTTGGQSYPASGTTGDGYRFAGELGHTILQPRPALVPLTTHAPWVLDLKGVTLPDVGFAIRDGDQLLDRRRNSLLFAHFGLTGPAALDASRVVSGHPSPGSLTAEIDLVPSANEDQLLDQLKSGSASAGKRPLSGVVHGLVPRRLGDAILQLLNMRPDKNVAEVSRDEWRRLAQALKRLPVPLTGTLGFKKAEVTAGGVALDEVDSRTLESKLVPGLFLAGEILDLDGPIGGYNFQAAWSTGWLAGGSVVSRPANG